MEQSFADNQIDQFYYYFSASLKSPVYSPGVSFAILLLLLLPPFSSTKRIASRFVAASNTTNKIENSLLGFNFLLLAIANKLEASESRRYCYCILSPLFYGPPK